MTSDAFYMVQFGLKSFPASQKWFLSTLDPQNEFLKFFQKSTVWAQKRFFTLHGFTSLKKAFLSIWFLKLTCFSIFDFIWNASNSVEYGTISTFSKSGFFIQGLLLKKSIFCDFLLQKQEFMFSPAQPPIAKIFTVYRINYSLESSWVCTLVILNVIHV